MVYKEFCRALGTLNHNVLFGKLVALLCLYFKGKKQRVLCNEYKSKGSAWKISNKTFSIESNCDGVK
jgi:hypothetical protein